MPHVTDPTMLTLLTAGRLAADGRVQDAVTLCGNVATSGHGEAFVFIRGLATVLAGVLDRNPDWGLTNAPDMRGIDDAIDILYKQAGGDEKGSQLAAFLLSAVAETDPEPFVNAAMFLLGGIGQAVRENRLHWPGADVTITTQSPETN